MNEIQMQVTADGAILFDPGVLAQAGHGTFDPLWFEPGHWQTAGRASSVPGGRGGAIAIDTPLGSCILRHYCRGGMVARFLGDRYLWTGAERTRAFAEFRLLAALVARGLRVPRPVAARYCRHGVYYRADLITRRIENAVSLAQCVTAGTWDARGAAAVGRALAEFHAAGVDHADLNAHNVLFGAGGVWLIDLDRGALRAPARTWQLANLARLRRSLRKIGAALAGEAAFERELWSPLLAAYESTLAARRAARGAPA
jgi:3-deoxy-D-manno-octulosonic acid kinase